ncbi:MAG TPA: hypothetical protein VD689_03965 [Nitrosopumilaceae archaeon]|nr:hypothetical protein [Nitrosopumilaceae archaeon]HXV51261.1 hypothetical protein [Nitrosopumilaceae archaeon]
MIKNFKKIEISGKNVDDAIIRHVKNNRGIVATVDMELKKKIKNHGSILSLANNRIVLEPSKT